MSKMNIPGYKGGSIQSLNFPKHSISAEQKRQEDIQGFVSSIQNKYHNNVVSKEDVITFIDCLGSLKNNKPIQTYPTSDILHKMVGFTQNMLKQNVVQNPHIELMIELLDNVIQNITPKTPTSKTIKTDGSISTLSQGYKK